MSPYAKAVLSALRLVALGCMLTSLLLYSNDIYLHLRHRRATASWVLALKGLPFLAGVALFWKSRAWAERLTEDLD